MDVGDVLEIHVASIISIYPEDEDSMYLRNVGNIVHILMV
jgi:hypothetical protein